MSATAISETGRVEYVGRNGGRLIPFQKGKSGNPSGYGGRYTEVRQLCANKSLDATHKLIELIDDSDSRVAFMAAQAVLERGIGKPRDHSNEGGFRVDLSALTEEDREKLSFLLRKMFGG